MERAALHRLGHIAVLMLLALLFSSIFVLAQAHPLRKPFLDLALTLVLVALFVAVVHKVWRKRFRQSGYMSLVAVSGGVVLLVGITVLVELPRFERIVPRPLCESTPVTTAENIDSTGKAVCVGAARVARVAWMIIGIVALGGLLALVKTGSLFWFGVVKVAGGAVGGILLNTKILGAVTGDGKLPTDIGIWFAIITAVWAAQSGFEDIATEIQKRKEKQGLA